MVVSGREVNAVEQEMLVRVFRARDAETCGRATDVGACDGEGDVKTCGVQGVSCREWDPI